MLGKKYTTEIGCIGLAIAKIGIPCVPLAIQPIYRKITTF
jgi:hypothetical protein